MGLPGSPKVVLLNGMGNLFRYGNLGPDIVGEMFARKDYAVEKGTAFIDRLKSVKEAGVFYLNTHGGDILLKDGQSEFVIWTTDSSSADNKKRYHDDLSKQNLATIFSKTTSTGTAILW